MHIVIVLFGAIFIGFIEASWGARKDTRLGESFSIRKFFKSPILFFLISAILLVFAYDAHPIFIIFASPAIARILVEFLKLISGKPPGKFINPQRDTRWLRIWISELVAQLKSQRVR
ncbi:MAG: hypothetical protein KJI69_00660 [Patescibacteria group bacterium]|nr:hypothetical protein [Patescibacteria group bacterium]